MWTVAQGGFCVRVDDYAGKARRYSHIRRVEVSSVVDGGDRPEGDRNRGGGVNFGQVRVGA